MNPNPNPNPKRKEKTAGSILTLVIVVLFIIGGGLVIGSRFISQQLLQANKNMAVDVALLVKNNFEISDAEVQYMKGLSFNEMEVDPINQRLMNVGNGVSLNAAIRNVYVLAALSADEQMYQVDGEDAAFFGYEPGTMLDGIWLLNGKINEEGHFEAAEREDIYRYTCLTETQRKGIAEQTAFGDYSQDAWGSFITGYAPIYTTEGNFIGLLGIDMDLDAYQERARRMLSALMIAFSATALAIATVFLLFHFQLMRMKESRLYFDFYSRMSHDMRTPMNGILGMAALSKKENDVDVLHHNFALIEESGQYMLRLINDTLDVQILNAGKLRLTYQTKQYGELVSDIAAMVRPSAEEKNIHLGLTRKNIDMESLIRIDVLRVQQIFMNLMSNAIKFTPEGGSIKALMECVGRDNKVVHNRFQISDTGIGMSEEFIKDYLYQPFAQEQNSVTTKYGGSGLGLSIVKNLVDLMGGRIEVTSIQGKGTTFTVYLDFEIVEEDKPQKKSKAEEAGKKSLEILRNRHILLCEDQPLNAVIASRLLEEYDCVVTVAQDGQDGIDTFLKNPVGSYDLILMDIRMPVMDGLMAAESIRELEREDAKRIPIIALTANTYQEDIQNCLDAGMNGHIAKPIEPQVMYRTIADILSQV